MRSSPGRILFRTDASLDIGTGHVMRCLTLADALRERGAEAVFICRAHRGHLLKQIRQRGHEVRALSPPPPSYAAATDDPPHAAWLGLGWDEDAQETLQLAAGERADWLVVDHYALDRRWEQAVRPVCRRLMAMDDLADRAHDCDLLLDPSLGREAREYAGHVPNEAKVLLGPDYALLRPEFAELRAESLARREEPALRHVLVTMGGVDMNNATGRVLDAIEASTLPAHLRITVVLGPHAPWVAEIEKRAERIHFRTSVRSAVADMARLMSDSDLAIGAAGSTSWERFCLGLPTLQFTLAENQVKCAREFAQRGAVVDFDLAGNFEASFVDLLGKLDVTRLRSMAFCAAQICDGLGAKRVVRAMLARGNN